MSKVTQLLLLQYSYIHYFVLPVPFLIHRHFTESEILQVKFTKVFFNMGGHTKRYNSTGSNKIAALQLTQIAMHMKTTTTAGHRYAMSWKDI
jgi:hypothetical protein